MAMIFDVTPEDFRRRYAMMSRKVIDNPVRYAVQADSFELFWTDVDGCILHAVFSKNGFPSAEHELDFRNEFFVQGTRVLLPEKKVEKEEDSETADWLMPE